MSGEDVYKRQKLKLHRTTSQQDSCSLGDSLKENLSDDESNAKLVDRKSAMSKCNFPVADLRENLSQVLRNNDDTTPDDLAQDQKLIGKSADMCKDSQPSVTSISSQHQKQLFNHILKELGYAVTEDKSMCKLSSCAISLCGQPLSSSDTGNSAPQLIPVAGQNGSAVPRFFMHKRQEKMNNKGGRKRKLEAPGINLNRFIKFYANDSMGNEIHSTNEKMDYPDHLVETFSTTSGETCTTEEDSCNGSFKDYYSIPLSSGTDVTEPCAVCEDRATGLHYGIMTCEGCKGFFKRTVQNRRIYECAFNGDCDVLLQKRNNCQYCRFKKCLEKGMVVEAVRENHMPGGRNSMSMYGKMNLKRKRDFMDNQDSSDASSQASVNSLPRNFKIPCVPAPHHHIMKSSLQMRPSFCGVDVPTSSTVSASFPNTTREGPVNIIHPKGQPSIFPYIGSPSLNFAMHENKGKDFIPRPSSQSSRQQLPNLTASPSHVVLPQTLHPYPSFVLPYEDHKMIPVSQHFVVSKANSSQPLMNFCSQPPCPEGLPNQFQRFQSIPRTNGITGLHVSPERPPPLFFGGRQPTSNPTRSFPLPLRTPRQTSEAHGFSQASTSNNTSSNSQHMKHLPIDVHMVYQFILKIDVSTFSISLTELEKATLMSIFHWNRERMSENTSFGASFKNWKSILILCLIRNFLLKSKSMDQPDISSSAFFTELQERMTAYVNLKKIDLSKQDSTVLDEMLSSLGEFCAVILKAINRCQNDLISDFVLLLTNHTEDEILSKLLDQPLLHEAVSTFRSTCLQLTNSKPEHTLLLFASLVTDGIAVRNDLL